MTQKKVSRNKIFIFPLTFAVIFFASMIIIFSPMGQKNIVNIAPTLTPTPNYICPKNAWVDCMPSPDKVKTECQEDYLNWAKINCPKFKGVAY